MRSEPKVAPLQVRASALLGLLVAHLVNNALPFIVLLFITA